MCRKPIDEYLLRLQLGEGLAIHAAKWALVPAYTRIDRDGVRKDVSEEEVIKIACSWRRVFNRKTDKLVSHHLDVTCKSCRIQLGLDKKPENDERFVVMHKSTGKFLKKRRYDDVWVSNVMDATCYRAKHAAIKKTERAVYFDSDGNKIPRQKWVELRKQGQHLRMGTEISPNYEIKPVKISIG